MRACANFRSNCQIVLSKDSRGFFRHRRGVAAPVPHSFQWRLRPFYRRFVKSFNTSVILARTVSAIGGAAGLFFSAAASVSVT